MRNFLLALLSLILFGMTLAKPSYEDFLMTLKYNGINTSSLAEKKSVSRYELARLLNAIECHDCVHPDSIFEQKYTFDNWKKFIEVSGKNFSDISAPLTKFLGENYFYCVAYAADHEHMQGYTKYISPICANRFCGERTLNTAEFYQVLVNVLDGYIYSKYTVDWGQVATWYTSLMKDSYAYLYLNDQDRSIIQQNSNKKNKKLANVKEFQTYTKYCMFNLSACGFDKVNDISQAFWPISQINILLQNKIISGDKINQSRLFGLVSGKDLLQALYLVSDITVCESDNDYDKDKILNIKDNCPNHFNPHQRDLDGDGIGDVCDDDIDGDGIKNPIGIVDDSGRVDIEKLKLSQDNCLFVVNPDQKKTKDNFFGDACVTIGDRLGATIVIKKIGYYAPMNTIFFGKIEGKWDRAEWDFGDGGIGKGQEVGHTFLDPGVYTVKLKVSNATHVATSSTTVVVGLNPDLQVALQTIDPILVHKHGKCVKIVPRKVGLIDKFIVDFDGEIKEYLSDIGIFEYCFVRNGKKKITTKAIKQNNMVAVSVLELGIGDTIIGGNLLASALTPKLLDQVDFTTKIKGFKLEDIKSIVWDFGDGVKEKNIRLRHIHRYSQSGPKLVKQHITLYSGDVVDTALTLYIVDPMSFKSYSLYQNLKKLFWNARELVTISYHEGKDQEEIGALVDNGNWNKNFARLPSIAQDYYVAGKYLPFSEEYLSGGVILKAHSTFWVDGKDICVEASVSKNFSSFHCDMDKDGIPDLCDSDIDGDGIKNLLNILVREPKNCKYGPKDIDPNILKENEKYPGGLDNCFLVTNSDQKDSDGNGKGDVCDNGKYIEKDPDRDGDGIRDAIDSCPDLPETYNKILDRDGCPEINQGTDPLVTPATCYACPCNYVDYADDLAPKSKIKVELKSVDKKSLYDVSPSLYVSDFL